MSKETISVWGADGHQHLWDAPLPPGMVMHLTFYRRHLPSGTILPELAYFENRHAYESCLNQWNRLGGDTWLYVATESEVWKEMPGAIIAQGMARHLWNNLPADRLTLVKLEHRHKGELQFSIDARRCGRLVDGKPVLTGGAEVSVLLRNARYTPWAMEQKSYKLAPGWDEGQFKLAVTKAYQWAQAGLVRMAAAEALWDDVQRLSGREGFSEAIAAWEKEHGESRSYREMTVEEITRWHGLVKAWEQENPPRE